MKNFEDKFEKASAGCDVEVECGNLRCEECKTLAEYWYSLALEFAENQFLGKSAFEAEVAIHKERNSIGDEQ